MFDLVVPTIGRPTLSALLAALDGGTGPLPGCVVLVDDRHDPRTPLPIPPLSPALSSRLVVLASAGRGPAAARNVGWRAASAPWVVFVDDDVVPRPGWPALLDADLIDLPADVAGSQARLHVPLPEGRRPTDWERNVARLEAAEWITADMAYRRDVLEEVGGFDERFRRAYREDSDLALRVVRRGYRIVRGVRISDHPVTPADRWVSVRAQAGNADDLLMRALHGNWRNEPRRVGRLPFHLATTAAGVVALGAALARRRRLASFAGLCWLAGTGSLAWGRIAPGPRDRDELGTMLLTSVAIPPAASVWHVLGRLRLPRLLADGTRAPKPRRRLVPAPVVLPRAATTNGHRRRAVGGTQSEVPLHTP